MNDQRSDRTRGSLGWAVAAILALAVVILTVALVRGEPSTPGGTATTTVTRADTVARSGLATVALADLPAQARDTVGAIQRGGPFPYAKDGAVFQNREGILPRRPRGYYREYTVTTPGSDDRGARRIVTGDGDREFFYTDDHYESFREVRL